MGGWIDDVMNPEPVWLDRLLANKGDAALALGLAHLMLGGEVSGLPIERMSRAIAYDALTSPATMRHEYFALKPVQNSLSRSDEYLMLHERALESGW